MLKDVTLIKSESKKRSLPVNFIEKVLLHSLMCITLLKKKINFPSLVLSDLNYC